MILIQEGSIGAEMKTIIRTRERSLSTDSYRQLQEIKFIELRKPKIDPPAFRESRAITKLSQETLLNMKKSLVDSCNLM